MSTQNIHQLIDQTLTKLALPQVNYTLDSPDNPNHGDLATNVAMVLAPVVKQSPMSLAQTIVEQINLSKSENIEAISIAAPGFINFFYSNQGLVNLYNNFITQSNLTNPTNIGKTVIVEYSSPNIAKPFTVGHLRSTIIGDAIANIKAATGWTVLRDNHLGDWGTQFGKLICAIKQNWIPFDQIETSNRPVQLLVDLYVRFHQEAESNPTLEDEARAWFKKLEDGDIETRQLWQKCIDWSWKEFNQIYTQLGVCFSSEFNQGRGLGESFFEDKMQTVVDQLNQAQLLESGELGAQIVSFGDQYPPLMILKKDGATLYSTRDLATDYYRKTHYHPDLVINEVGSEQALYFKQLFEIESRLGWYQPSQRVHVGHGMYRFKDGKMSTRKGNVIWLEEVIAKATEKAKGLLKPDIEHPQELAQIIGIGALKWNDLKGEPKRDIVFDWADILSMKGNSGPYVQYTYARTHSVISKATSIPQTLDSSFVPNPEERLLIKSLLQFPQAVTLADSQNNPAVVAGYIYNLCQQFNCLYNLHPILNSPNRLTLTQKTSTTIKLGLSLLGIAAPEKM